MSESWQSPYSGKNAMVQQELELQRASRHAFSRTEGGQSRAAVGFFYESDALTENKSWSRSSKRKLSARMKRKKLGIDHQHGQY